MSILNVSLCADRALIAVDTECKISEPGKKHHYRDASKLFALPHANVLIGVRGDIPLASLIFGHVAELNIQSFDDAAALLPTWLRNTYNQHEAVAEALRTEVTGIELALVGWSPSKGSMAGHRWQRIKGQKDFQDQAIETWALSPDPGLFDEPAAPDTAEQMADYARAQVKTILQADGTAGVGGKLLLAELTRDALSVRQIADLWRHG